MSGRLAATAVVRWAYRSRRLVPRVQSGRWESAGEGFTQMRADNVYAMSQELEAE